MSMPLKCKLMVYLDIVWPFYQRYWVGRNMFVKHRGYSVVDYFLTRTDVFNFLEHFELQEPNMFSDTKSHA